MRDRGVTMSGIYDLDPDGQGIGHPPIKAYCDFVKNTTEIFHDKEELIKVEKCPEVGCAAYEVNYSAPPEQIEALIALSENCYQDLSFGCFMAPLNFDNVNFGFWSDKNGNPQYYFNVSYNRYI